MTNKEIIDGLKYTMDMCLFDANTGEYDSKENLNDMTRITYDACEGAIKALEAQPCIEDYPTCTECEHYDREKHYCPRFCQVIRDTLAEAQPKKGKWIEIEIDAGEFIYKCSKCGMRVVNQYNYCPMCGSYNGGGEDGKDTTCG